MRVGAAIALAVVLIPAIAVAQAAGSGGGATYAPITSAERVTWVAQGTASLPALGVGAVNSAWMTTNDWPKEWPQSMGGFWRRYADGQASASLSDTIEAGLGTLWGEDPRYVRSGRQGLWPRVRHAVTTVGLASRRDGHLAPAWGRLAGNVIGNAIENSWLPPSVATRRQTMLRMADGMVGRLVSNVWDEFWPDLRERLPPTPQRLRRLVGKD